MNRAKDIAQKLARAGWPGISAIALLWAIWPGAALAQEQSPASSTAPAPAPVSTRAPDNANSSRETHRFWDKENDWLFAGVGASRTLDYFSTLNFRRRGRQEILLTNDLVDDHPAFAAVETGATGLSIGVSYIFHRYGHHKLERWTSFVHIGLATTGAIRNYSLKTAHPASAATASAKLTDP
jgi:hypothetical protein